MEIITKSLTQVDLQQALRIEAAAMPDNRYLADVWQLFTQETDGDLLGAFVNGTLQGIGKITRLYKDIGWLETLRVHPDWQGQGLGKAIWRQFFIEMEKMQLQHVGMYTEEDNIVSKTLGEKFGLRVAQYHTEYRAPVQNNVVPHTFSPVTPHQAEQMLSPYYTSIAPFLVINRTFYPVKEGLAEHFAKNQWLYSDAEDNLLVAGNRFHPERLLHVPLMLGDPAKCLHFAHHLASQQNTPSLSCLIPSDDSISKEKLTSLGFSAADTFMTLWKSA